jgi:hypothetical protein
MKISQKVLQQIIIKELSRVNEDTKKTINEAQFSARRSVTMSMLVLDSQDLIKFAKLYQSLGAEAQKQLDKLMIDSEADCNENIVNIIENTIGGYNEEIDDALHDWQLSIKSVNQNIDEQ